MNTSQPNSFPAFVHNLDTCVGCHACVLACANENKLEPGTFWRQIVSYNPARIPDLPTYHLSLACNHCLDAPCMKGCPAIAIERDPRTGAVLIKDDKCIGCRYCSWVCPYDAPQFNSNRGIMEKCTFCNHRLLEDKVPACASLCPTGALSIGTYGEKEELSVEGFPAVAIRPSITFLPMKGRAPQPAPQGAIIPSETDIAALQMQELDRSGPPKISLKNEWPLAVFSFIGIALVAWFLSALAGGRAVLVEVFGVAGLLGMLFSTMHLGRKLRAWRAILNIRSSWLSREVVAFPLFLLLAITSVLFYPASTPLLWATAFVGAGFLICVDAVYAVMAREWSSQLDGQTSVLSAAFVVSVLTGNLTMAAITGMVRLYAVADRMQKRRIARRVGNNANVLSLLRAFFGFVVPAFLWVQAGEATLLVVGFALVGEFLDRLDFYDALDILTPRRAMARSLRMK